MNSLAEESVMKASGYRKIKWFMKLLFAHLTKFELTRHFIFLVVVYTALLLGAESSLQSGKVFAQTVDVSGRSKVSDEVNLAVSPRAAALGNAFVAIRNDPNSIFSNPACLSTIKEDDSSGLDRIVAFSFTHHVLDINEGTVVYAQPVPENVLFAGEFAVGVQYFSGGSFTESNNVGQRLGSFNSGDYMLTAAYSSAGANNLHYGVAAKVVSSNLVSGSSVSNASALWIAADLGLYYEIKPLLLSIGLSALNLGSELSTYNGVRESIGPNVQLGIAKKLERLPLTLSLAFHNLTRDREGRTIFYAFDDFSIGGEFILGKVVRLRVGYQNEVRHDLQVPVGNGLAGFSAGVGLVFKQYHIDVAYDDQGPAFSPMLRLGGSVAF